MTIDLPRLLSDFPLLPGLIKADYTDFEVEEIPLYPFDGAGTHVYFLVEKVGLSTMQAAGEIAQRLNISRRDIGYAGLKDARAVTRQWLSAEHVDEDAVRGLEGARLRVVEVTRHRNKLKLGHLRGNRFLIKVRQTQPDRLAELQDALQTLVRRGVPNYFGPQRFGSRGDTWMSGRAIVREQYDEVVDLVLGRPTEHDHGDIRRARKLYELGQYAEAARLWPGMFRDERRALHALAKTNGKKKRAYLAIDEVTRTFYVSAYQSYLFNRVLALRLPHGLDRLMLGDLATRHANDAVFLVEDPEKEQPRADAFEISPSGPLFGYRTSEPQGEPARMEAEVLAGEELTREAFRQKYLRVKGGRRPLRFAIEDAAAKLGADERGPYLSLAFALPRGCYATAVLRELFTAPQAAEEGPHPGEPEP
ncbi:MAG: tRNA pseudouridine(13) synthase TruD [Phycisphaerae bacterium]